MGKPYASELARLSETYAWSMNVAIGQLAHAISAAARLPLLSTGSGGSLTAAHFAAELHQQRTGMIAKAATPVEVIAAPPTGKAQAALIVSAGGKNSDIIAVFKRLVEIEPKRLIVICAGIDSPLSQLARAHRYVDLIELRLPSGKDGFLATNSLLAFVVTMARAWAAAVGAENPLPFNFAALQSTSLDLADRCAPLWQRKTLSVLYGPSTRVAAVDLESKFTEAALGSVQIADYRNFAHGRHHWLAKHGEATGLLAFITDDDRVVAKRTLSLIPKDVLIVPIEIPTNGDAATIAALLSTYYLAAAAGEARGIDPGRPGVPSFGSKIYHLPSIKVPVRKRNGLAASDVLAIEKKTGVCIDKFTQADELNFWKDAHRRFLRGLKETTFGGIVLDYDGTLCDSKDRFTGVGSDVAVELTRLLQSGVVVGIATGRGRSVRIDFQRFLPSTLWERCLVGYYNGGDIALLSDNDRPDRSEVTERELEPIARALSSNNRVIRLGSIECRRKQITIVPRSAADFGTLWKTVEQLVQETDTGATAVCSSHSLDILARGVTKQTIVEQVKLMSVHSPSLPVLCIGDRGQWPGNDFALLSSPFSLSCDEVSLDPKTCWNLALAGQRGVQATLGYLRAITCQDGSFKFRTSNK